MVLLVYCFHLGANGCVHPFDEEGMKIAQGFPKWAVSFIPATDLIGHDES